MGELLKHEQDDVHDVVFERALPAEMWCLSIRMRISISMLRDSAQVVHQGDARDPTCF